MTCGKVLAFGMASVGGRGNKKKEWASTAREKGPRVSGPPACQIFKATSLPLTPMGMILAAVP